MFTDHVIYRIEISTSDKILILFPSGYIGKNIYKLLHFFIKDEPDACFLVA